MHQFIPDPDTVAACTLSEPADHPEAEGGFTPRDRDAILRRLDAYPDWTVEFATTDGTDYALLRTGLPRHGAPALLLARNQGLTAAAATWPDGRQLRAGLAASLSTALQFVIHILDDLIDDAPLALNPADPGPYAVP